MVRDRGGSGIYRLNFNLYILFEICLQRSFYIHLHTLAGLNNWELYPKKLPISSNMVEDVERLTSQFSSVCLYFIRIEHLDQSFVEQREVHQSQSKPLP